MPTLAAGWLDPTRLLVDLQRSNEIMQAFAGCRSPQEIARKATDGLTQKFELALARIWLLEPNSTDLQLIASSGLYTHVNGSFARVPMGAYKVGKIAQNRVSFLSNQLADEAWVKDRDWAIANHICGFAGYPLTVGDRVVGVLATFSHQAMDPGFLEVLQTLCAAISIAIDAALDYQMQQKQWQQPATGRSPLDLPLSDQVAEILTSARLMLIGTEQPLNLAISYLLLKTADWLNQLGCTYCRLLYGLVAVELEALIPVDNTDQTDQAVIAGDIQSTLTDVRQAIAYAGGTMDVQQDHSRKTIQVHLAVPYPHCDFTNQICIHCQQSVLQLAFTHLAQLAQLTLCDLPSPEVPLLTDRLDLARQHPITLWVQQADHRPPKTVRGVVHLSTSATELREAVTTISQGQRWGMEPTQSCSSPLSEREVEIMALLARGMRDRDIANHLIVSESTVKFHINNVLGKLQARTRYQALYQATIDGWLPQ